MSNHSHIELFAGCGGMTLGLEAAGFELYFANELSPMAGETFAYNLLQEDLDSLSIIGQAPKNTLWVKSKFENSNLVKRLRENPFEAKDGSFSDLNPLVDFKNKLLIGDIDELLKWLNENPDTIRALEEEDITLLSGGPPCQSFSMAGKREKNNAKNLLPLSFAKFAGLVKPKFVVLENVKGITSAFTENGEKHYAWFEVAKAFATEGYVPLCMLLNSKYFGVAQNRPRFILLAIRFDLAEELSNKIDDFRLKEALKFYLTVQETENLTDISLNSLHYYNIETAKELFDGVLFPKITSAEGKFISAAEAIGDLKRTDGKSLYLKSRVIYRDSLNEIFRNPFPPNGSVQYNHEARGHSYEVKARFRLYQVINEFQNGNKKTAFNKIVGKKVGKQELDNLLHEFVKHDLYIKNGGKDGYYKKLETTEEVKAHLKNIETRKHSQRALKEDEPAPAQLTIPDDICHYDMSQLRTLTVREMARLQSFPDWFKFRSKVTTGGSNRRFEVPQYTQVGNAVPPLLAFELGRTIIGLLKQINEP